MPDPHKLSDLALFMTRRGHVAISSDHQLRPDAELALFGDSGRYPPVSLLDLTQQTLDQIKTAPDASDAVDLRAFADTLQSSLTLVERALSKLNDG